MNHFCTRNIFFYFVIQFVFIIHTFANTDVQPALKASPREIPTNWKLTQLTNFLKNLFWFIILVAFLWCCDVHSFFFKQEVWIWTSALMGLLAIHDRQADQHTNQRRTHKGPIRKLHFPKEASFPFKDIRHTNIWAYVHVNGWSK